MRCVKLEGLKFSSCCSREREFSFLLLIFNFKEARLRFNNFFFFRENLGTRHVSVQKICCSRDFENFCRSFNFIAAKKFV